MHAGSCTQAGLLPLRCRLPVQVQPAAATQLQLCTSAQCPPPNPRFDHILIETTGLADPAPVAQTFFVDEDLKHSLRLDSILTGECVFVLRCFSYLLHMAWVLWRASARVGQAGFVDGLCSLARA